MVLDASLINTLHYKVRIMGKLSNPRKEVEPSPTPRGSSYWKGNLRIALENGLTTYIGCTEVTTQKREFIIDDQVCCIEFGKIYVKFYFIVRDDTGNVTIYQI